MDRADSENVPGTVYLVDLEHTRSQAQHVGKKDILLVPRPLLTKRDPLNWPRYKKYWSLFLVSLFACVMSFGENNLGAAWTTVSEDAHVSIEQMNGGSALNFSSLGFCNLLWVPTAMKFGRKACFIGAMTMNMCSLIWNAYFNGTAQWYGLCIVGGFGTAAYEAIIQLTIFDIFFAHERGTMLAVYIWGMQLGSILGLILGGYMSDGVGWRWSCSIGAILSGAVMALFLFTFDDSLFPRQTFGDSIGTAQDTARSLMDDPEAIESPNGKTEEKAATPVVRTLSTSAGTIDLPPRTYLQVLNPIHVFPTDRTRWLQYFIRPFQLFLFANIVIAGIIFAFGATAGIVSFNTISEIMTEPPYSWKDGPAGLMFISALIGSILGMGTANLGDRIVIFLARRHGGWKEPEMRLWTLAISFLYAAVGYFAYGWGAEAGASWPCIAVGLGAMIAHQVSATSIATAYAMECFEGIAGESVVVLACCSSLINFAISESVQPFIDATNYGWTFTFFGVCVSISVGLAIPLMVWGKAWRVSCKGRYDRFLKEGHESSSS